MRGQRVVCRDVNGIPLVRRVWAISEKKVYVHDEANFFRHGSGEEYLEPVGFPREDVFVLDSGGDAISDVAAARGFTWGDMRPINCDTLIGL